METLLNISLGITILIFSVIVHENAHGLAALALGDQTAKRAGRLSLNPLKHVDIFGSIIVPFISVIVFGFIFGWAKPVPINPRYFKDQRKGMMITSIAGPFSNFVIAILASIVLNIGVLPALSSVLAFVVLINVLLGVFNLLPIPPLDGSKVVEGLLPRAWLSGYYKIEHAFERYFFIIFLLIFLIDKSLMYNFLISIIRPILDLLGVGSIV